MSSTEIGYIHKVRFSSVTVDDEVRKVMNARVVFGRSRRDPDTDEYKDTGSVWVNLALWGPQAEQLEGMIVPGVSILAIGRYSTEKWTDQEGVERIGFRFAATQIGLLPRSIESVTFKERTSSLEERHDLSDQDEFDIPQ